MLSQTLPVYDQNQSKPHHKRLKGDVINATTKPIKVPRCQFTNTNNIPQSGNYDFIILLEASYSEGCDKSTLCRPQIRFSPGGRKGVSSISLITREHLFGFFLGSPTLCEATPWTMLFFGISSCMISVIIVGLSTIA